IEKNIPMAAGLAGGSADAAAVFFGLNSLIPHSSHLTAKELSDLGAKIGSDIPFCLTGGTCLVEGRGEDVSPQQPLAKTHFILVNPGFEVSTKWAYETFDQMENEEWRMKNECKNDLEAVVVAKYPEIIKIKERLLSLGCSQAQMSGSGPTVFGIVGGKEEAEAVFARIKQEYPRSFLVETVDKGVEVV
ncbi:MAG: 4-(cytidine 5'-diphospho)-2-C-methyl-D-erythritol kinase, partial [Candidatus Margulisbacteria bacterium]|nr:4-(cytidine 5'-diphospho)-2-C-methyl-D-erythritol kinase [Candidatus Margulisiibacteriota bacterium]